MNCPYCAEPIKDAALVCKHCHRELFVVRPLIEKLADATKQLEALQAVTSGTAAPNAFITNTTPASPLPGMESLSAALLTFIILVASHYLIIVTYSLPLIWLRSVSIAIPFLFGLVSKESRSRSMFIELVIGIAIAAVSVLVMSFVVGKIDNVPVLPRNSYEWREFAEYGASIAFGFFTGAALRRTLIATMSPEVRPTWLIGLASRAIAEKLGGHAAGFNFRTTHIIVSTMATIGSAAASIITGLRQFF